MIKIKKFALLFMCTSLISFQANAKNFFGNFVDNIHGKNICKKIATEFNKTRKAFYLDTKSNTATGEYWRVGSEGVNAFDSEYKFVKRDERNKYSHDKGVCKIWIKGKQFTDRPYIIIDSNFYLVDKHGAKLKYTDESIKEIKVTPGETVALTFDFYDGSIEDAEDVVFSYNNHYLPMSEEEYCLEQTRLHKEAKETYHYEYNDLLSCDCNPPSKFNYYYSQKDDSKCKIFNDDKVRENCILLSKVVPSCNEWIKKRNTENGYTNLMSAASNGKTKPDDIKKLIKAGADVNAKDKNGTTALMYAASENSNLQILKELIKAGADVNARDNDDNTALMYATRMNSNPEVVRELIKAGADVGAKNKYEATPLILSFENKNKEIMKALLNGTIDKIKEEKKEDIKTKSSVSEEQKKLDKGIVSKLNKKDKLDLKLDCNTFQDCETNYQKSKFCRCLEYENAKNNPNTILATQPQECIEFCKYISSSNSHTSTYWRLNDLMYE